VVQRTKKFPVHRFSVDFIPLRLYLAKIKSKSEFHASTHQSLQRHSHAWTALAASNPARGQGTHSADLRENVSPTGRGASLLLVGDRGERRRISTIATG
jgi:hypothetical protein